MDIKSCDFEGEIKNNRIVLRKLEKDDKSVIFDIYSNEESSLLDDWEPYKSIDDAEDMITRAQKGFANKSELTYGIKDISRDIIVGCCGLFDLDEWNQKCMIFYIVHQDERSKGYATEAIKLLVNYAFSELGFNRIEAYITPGNYSSIKVLEKNGFVKEGVLREVEFYKGKFWDGIVMAMLKKDYLRS